MQKESEGGGGQNPLRFKSGQTAAAQAGQKSSRVTPARPPRERFMHRSLLGEVG